MVLEKPGNKKFDELVTAMAKHQSLPLLEIVQRYRFHPEVKKPKEYMAACAVELRTLAQKSNFDDTLCDKPQDRLAW